MTGFLLQEILKAARGQKSGAVKAGIFLLRQLHEKIGKICPHNKARFKADFFSGGDEVAFLHIFDRLD